jgi:hypothetical protein
MTRPGSSTTLTRASAQWRERPPDERYSSIEDLRHAAHQFRARSTEEIVDLSACQLGWRENEMLIDDKPMSNWAFGQLCTKLKAPASYMRTLPEDLVIQNLKHGHLTHVAPGDMMKLLVGPSQIGAFTGEGYARIWNAEIADWLMELQSEQPWWTFPTSFKTAGGGVKSEAWGESKELPVAFLSDRDCFVFLCDYDHPIEVPGAETPLSRGFWVENNEVGAGSVRITMFLFDFVCSNVLVWGARNVIEVKVAHKGRARERILFEDSEARQAIVEYANRSSMADTLRIERAQNMLVADTQHEVIDLLYGKRLPGLSKNVLTEAMAVAGRTERYQLGGGPTSVWAVINGITEVSQKNEHADARIEIDRSAARILDAMVPVED